MSDSQINISHISQEVLLKLVVCDTCHNEWSPEWFDSCNHCAELKENENTGRFIKMYSSVELVTPGLTFHDEPNEVKEQSAAEQLNSLAKALKEDAKKVNEGISHILEDVNKAQKEMISSMQKIIEKLDIENQTQRETIEKLKKKLEKKSRSSKWNGYIAAMRLK